ncbi:hypothetical protein M271_00630 [Streptomyces rapamycinicus NRRL 5491]|nr:hypothetical protein M271_00630 [Streptomyces rapamycinicus NRRL 5491]
MSGRRWDLARRTDQQIHVLADDRARPLTWQSAI